MKKVLFLLIVPIFLFSCTKNKSVIEQLTVDQVAELIDEDIIYEYIIAEVELIKKARIKDDIVLLSKYKDLTYKDICNYSNTVYDIDFTTPIRHKADSLYTIWQDSLLTKYKHSIWLKREGYKNEMELKNPENYFEISFLEIRQVYYESINKIKDVMLKFRIETKNGRIKGGSFDFDLVAKSTGNSVATMGCRFSQNITNSSKLVYDANYEMKSQLEWLTTAHVKEYYTFKFTNLSVLTESDDTYTFNGLYIPLEFKIDIDKDTITDKGQYLSMIEQTYFVKYKTSGAFYKELFEEECKNLDALSYSFLHL